MGITLKNNAKTTLSSAITSTDTTIPVTDTSSFPALGVGDYFYCTIESTTGTQEIVKVTQVNNTNFLATRAQEGTIAIPFATGARVELRITVQSLEDQFGVAVPDAVDDYLDTLPVAYTNVENPWNIEQTFIGANVDGATPAYPAHLHLLKNGVERWLLARNTDAESGSNAGSNLELWAYNDAGGSNIKVFEVARDTGVWDFLVNPTIGGSNILKASDIGSSVQAYDADTAKLDVAQTWTANQSFNTAIRPTTNDLAALGTSTLGWSDLFLADGASISFNNYQTSLTHGAGIAKVALASSLATALTFSLYRADTPVGSATGGIVSFEGNDQAGNFHQYGRQYCFHSTTTDASETGWFVWSLSSAGVFADRMQMTPTVLRPVTNDTMSLGDSALMWSDLFLAAGAVVNFNNGDVLLTHGADSLTLSGGRLNVQQGISSTNPSILVTQDNDIAQPIVAVFQGDRATPTAGDSAVIPFRLSDSAGNQDTAFQLQWGLTSVTSGSETGYLRLALISAGTLTNRLDLYNSHLTPVTNDGLALGTGANSWSDLFLASGGVINFNNGDVLITHSTNTLAFTGASTAYTFDAVVRPSANDAAALGSATVSWADLFLASGGVINFNNGNATLTHSTGLITSNVPFTATSTTAATAVFRALNNNNAAAVCAFRFEGDRSAPAANDAVYTDWVLSDSAGNQDIMGRIQLMGTTVTNGSEISLFRFSMVTLGVLTNSFEMTPGVFRPGTSDGASLGGASVHWSDLFLASGAVINFNNGDATLTHSTGRIASSVPVGLPSYTVAGLPAGSTGDIAYASNGRKNGEGAGLGTGVMVFKDGTAWRACDTGATVAA